LTHGKSLSFVSPKESDQRKGDPDRFARANNMRGCPALLANPERETNSPANEKPIRSGSNIVSRRLSVLAAVLGWLDGD